MKKSILILSAAVLVASAAITHAESYNQTVANNGGELYYGAGNPADNFATSTGTDLTGPVTIGLRASYNGSVGFSDISGPGGTYKVPAGLEFGSATESKWDYTFSVDIGPGKTITTGATGYDAELLIKDNTTGNTSTSFNALLIPDNDETGGKVYEGPTQKSVEQNAENLSFGIVGLTGYNPNAFDDYTITLTLTDTANSSFSLSDSINVDVAAAPLPASAWSGFALLGGLAVFGGKRLRRQLV